jgi:hypothetical protein
MEEVQILSRLKDLIKILEEFDKIEKEIKIS